MPTESDPSSTPHPGPMNGSAATPLIVGIGGSAGALAALIRILESLGNNQRLAIVVVLHLSPDHESHAAEILQRSTPLVVQQVTQRTRLEGGHVYVIAPGNSLITDDGHVQPGEASPRRPSTVIDQFFRSLGAVHRDNAVGVVLSGTGQDGCLGLLRIKECGGITLAQALDDCEHSDMPHAAQAAGAVDLMLRAADIGRRLDELANSPHPLLEALVSTRGLEGEGDGLEDALQAPELAFQDILKAVRSRTRHDFRNYKRATILRRLERRIQVNGLASIVEYRDLVRSDPKELDALLADMLISVTSFFRDPESFLALEHEVIPRIMKNAAPGEEARVWVPACASGEESYSVAILMQECADQMHHAPYIQLFASDINEAALATARQGAYPANIAADVTESRLHAFFEREGRRYRVRSSIRERIVFARHNVLGDPPFSRLDLVCCRNLLIYLDRKAQAAVLEMFAYALKPGGYLFLGNAESVDAASLDFETVSKEHHIYQLRSGSRQRLPPRMTNVSRPLPAKAMPPARGFDVKADDQLTALHARALALASPPSVLVDSAYDIERVSHGAGRYLSFGEGAPSRNLLSSVEADVRVELRTALFRAAATKQPVQAAFQRQTAGADGEARVLTLAVHSVRADGGGDGLQHWLVIFQESTRRESLTSIVPGVDWVADAVTQRLEEENRALKSHLQDTLDQSAVSTEELKASNEELQAINEELLSAKEELETSKEELQSVNEELTTVNAELRIKVDEAGRNFDDLRNLMEASEIATVFVDPGMRIKRFTPGASKLFSLIPSDIGRPLMDVKSTLRYDKIIEDATSAFKHLHPIERSVSSVNDEHFLARIAPYRTGQDKISGAVLTFVDVTKLREAEQRVRLSEDKLRAAIATSDDFAVVGTDFEGLVTTWNKGAEAMFGHTLAEIVGEPIDILFTPEDRERGVPEQERATASREGRALDERWHLRKDGTRFFCSGVTKPLNSADGLGYVKIARDVSDKKHHEEAQEAYLGSAIHSAATVKARAALKDRFLAVMSHELKQPLNLIQVNAELLVRLREARELPAVQRIGDTIMRAVAAQDTIVNDLLDLSRVQTGKLHLRKEPSDLVAIVQRFAEAMSADAAQKHIELGLQLPREPLVCDCDPVRIEQVVWNLLGNAIKFTGDGGTVTASLIAENGNARFEVADTGVGISPDLLPTVFELFNQGDVTSTPGQSRPGLGIGLALVRELVRAHGGRIRADSKGRGCGSTFTVWLPLAGAASQIAPNTQHRGPLACSLLIVDDNTENLEALALLLEMEGASVETASSGSDALGMLALNDYDVLLSDIGMPEMSGLQLMKQASALASGKRFKSIALTGFGSQSDERDALDAGFDAFLTKPVSVGRLRAAIEALVNP